MPCESCGVDMKPETLYWARTEGKELKYSHTNASECVPRSAPSGKCGGCDADAEERFDLNPLGSGKTASTRVRTIYLFFVSHRRLLFNITSDHSDIITFPLVIKII